VVNPLFTGLVAYVIRDLDDQTIATFQEVMEDILQDLNEAERIEEVDWFEDLFEHWLEHLDEEDVESNRDSFEVMVSTISPSQLVLLAVDLRNEILLESLPDMTYDLSSFHAVYFFRWRDGLQIEYSCRPVIRNNLPISNHLTGSLNDIFKQQLVEMLISPGLDALHDQAAKPFDLKKFDELVNVLTDYANSQPGAEREQFENIIFRIKQQLGSGPVVNNRKEVDLEWLGNGGGF
jgi:hypothetical protein